MRKSFPRLCAIMVLITLLVATPLSVFANEVPNDPAPVLDETSDEDTTTPVESPPSTANEDEVTPPESDLPSAVSPPTLLSSHITYMFGFADGTMQPDKVLSRAEAVSLIYRLMANPESGSGTCNYTDVNDNDWFASTVRALARLGMLDEGTTFRPNDAMTRAEFVRVLVHFAPDTVPTSHFSDVPADHPDAESIGKAVSLGWVSGFTDGTFGPDRTLSRAEACAILNRITGRGGDAARANVLLSLGLYKDIPANHWAGTTICEATVPHNADSATVNENWIDLYYDGLQFAPGVHNINGTLYAVDRYRHLVRNQPLGAYMADASGILTASAPSYQSNVPYISMLDGLGATVGCEPISSLMGLRAKGYATTVTPSQFLAHLPQADSNPEYGFVGSPYHSDGRYSSINPRPLTVYCNSYCQGTSACENFSGASIDAVRQELLAGNLIVAYQTYWWQEIRYANFLIDGRWQSMVANNHVRLIAGYDPSKGYYISDPYNPNTPGQAYQYWLDAPTFEKLWNQRKMGMVIR